MGHCLVCRRHLCSHIVYVQHSAELQTRNSYRAQKQKTDLLTDIVKLHEQHLHQLDEMIEDIGKEIQALKVQSGLHFSID